MGHCALWSGSFTKFVRFCNGRVGRVSGKITGVVIFVFYFDCLFSRACGANLNLLGTSNIN